MPTLRPLTLVLLTAPLLFTIPAVPAHDGGLWMVQWDVACATSAPTSPSLATVATRTVPFTPGELAVSEDKLLVSGWSSGGFRVYSLANPTAPSYVGGIGTSGTTLDMKASSDGDTVFVGTTGRIHVVNIANPSSPSLIRSVSFPVPQVDQGHMLHVHKINTKEYLFAASQSGSGVYIFEVTGTAANRNLVRIAQFAPGSPLAAHDMYVLDDPVLGKPVLFVANGFGGWIAADVSKPASPVPYVIMPNPDAGQSYLHTVMVEWVEGRRLVTTIAELGGNLLRVWDATILNAPILIAEWSSQTALGVVPSASSQHNIQMLDGRLYMAHYRCGFWVFDLRTLPTLPVFTAIAPVAHYAPQVATGQHWDLVIRNGYIYTSDMRMQDAAGGAFYAVTYSGITAGDPAFTTLG